MSQTKRTISKRKPPAPKYRPHCATVYKGTDAHSYSLADRVKVEVWKPYGSLDITITEEDNVVLKAVDGAGQVINNDLVKPDDLVGPEEDKE